MKEDSDLAGDLVPKPSAYGEEGGATDKTSLSNGGLDWAVASATSPAGTGNSDPDRATAPGSSREGARGCRMTSHRTGAS